MKKRRLNKPDQKLSTIYKDLELIYKQALNEGNFSVALKAKELQLKLYKTNSPLTQENSIESMSDEELLNLIDRLDSDE